MGKNGGETLFHVAALHHLPVPRRRGFPRGARAPPRAGRLCAEDVVADDEVLGRFPELPTQVRSALAAHEDIDTCVEVKLGTIPAAIRWA